MPEVKALLETLSIGLVEVHDAPIYHCSTIQRNQKLEELLDCVQKLKATLIRG